MGDYVGPGTQFSVLTTISNFDTMCVDVAIPMTQYLRYARPDRSLYENDGLLSDIRLTLADNRTYPYAGFYGYTRKDVSNDTGTIVLVVKFPNPALTLKAGQFARVEANIGELQPRIMVPQEAVEQTLGVNAVWVVRPDSTVEYRAVELGAPDSTMWGIVSGLAAGEQVVVVGRQRLTNGMKVVPQPQPEV